MKYYLFVFVLWTLCYLQVTECAKTKKKSKGSADPKKAIDALANAMINSACNPKDGAKNEDTLELLGKDLEENGCKKTGITTKLSSNGIADTKDMKILKASAEKIKEIACKTNQGKDVQDHMAKKGADMKAGCHSDDEPTN